MKTSCAVSFRSLKVKITFVSNFINHHQMPFCEAMAALPDTDFVFIQTQIMEAERRQMGWSVDTASVPYVHLLYEEEDWCRKRIMESDVTLFGWTGREDIVQMRLDAGLPSIRVSERIYREGQWRALSPRGLIAKYHEHIRFRNAPVYLLCAGAYVASDFHLIHAYPGKMYKWGYFPPLRLYEGEQYPDGPLSLKRGCKAGMCQPGKYPGGKILSAGSSADEKIHLLYAGRFLPLKHPEFAVKLAGELRKRGIPFHLDMAGAGEMEEELRKMAYDEEISDYVSFLGFQKPSAVRDLMERADVLFFTSNYLEGWGAVLGEGMNSGCGVVAGTQCGAAPYLIQNGVNGLLYNGEDYEQFQKAAMQMITDGEERRRMGLAAYHTIRDLWNADVAAERLRDFVQCITEGRPYKAPSEGPMSPAPIIRPFIRV